MKAWVHSTLCGLVKELFKISKKKNAVFHAVCLLYGGILEVTHIFN